MATRHLDKTQCKDYFDRVSRELGDKHAQIEVAGLGLGSQVSHAWTNLRGIAYDPRNDAFEVVTDDLDHLIPHPGDVYVEDDADGNQQIIRLKTPLLLPRGEAGR